MPSPPPPMTPERARATRLPLLREELRKARCAQLDDDFDQRETETSAGWRRRKDRLRAICHSCPALAACREIALRQQAAGPHGFIIAGLSGPQLRKLRVKERTSLTRAIAADVRQFDAERAYDRAYTAYHMAVTAPVSSTRTTNNAAVAAARAEFTARRARRRAAAGWSAAA